MIARSPGKRLARGLVMTVAVVVGVWVVPSWPLLVAALIAFGVYDGLPVRLVTGSVGLLVLLELALGWDVGVTSLAYAAAVFVLVLVYRVVALPAWAGADGWAISDAVRATLTAWGATLIAIGCSVAVQYWFYGRGFFWWRLGHQLSAVPWWTLPLGCAILLTVVRRIDVPFVRRTFS